MTLYRSNPTLFASAAALALISVLAGCKAKPAAPSDATLAAEINAQLSADQALAGTQVTAQVINGEAILMGNVSNDAQRTLAARDAAGVAGVKQVNIQGLPVLSATLAGTPPPPPAPMAPSPMVPQPNPHRPAPVARPYTARNDVPQPAYNPPPAPVQPRPVEPTTPPLPPRPTFRNVTLPAGSTIPVRVTQTLDSATTQTGDSFSGVIASDVPIDGMVAIPQGSAVSGHVDAVQEAAHFKGNSLLTVSLTEVRSRGEHIALATDPYSVKGNGRGKNTAEKAGGGAAVGAILGGIFGGGKGAAIGAAAGGGAGAGVNAVTRGQQVQIASESVVRFTLTNAITVRVRSDAGASPASTDSGLQPR